MKKDEILIQFFWWLNIMKYRIPVYSLKKLWNMKILESEMLML